MTDRFDPGDDRHRAMKRELMRGIALKDIATTGEVDEALESAGFQVIEGMDRAVAQEGAATPWYYPMAARGRLLDSPLRRIPLGRQAYVAIARLAEALGLFPKGSAEVVRLMDRTAKAYVAGGRAGVFTPLYCFLARKPL